MKQLLLVVLGCLPLGWFTVSSVVQSRTAVENTSIVDDRPKLDEAAMQSHAAALDRRAADDLPSIRNLVPLEPFSETPHALDGAALPDRFKPVATAWQQFLRSQAAVSNASRVYRGGAKMQPAEEADRLKTYLAANSLAGLRGGESLEQWCQQKITTLTEIEQTGKSLEEIRRRFEAKQYDEVLKRIAMLRMEALTPADKADIERYRGKSVFGLHWQSADRELATAGQGDVRIAKLDDFLKRSPLPFDTEDQQLRDRREQERLDLTRKLRIDHLFKEPPELLADLLDECGRILDDDPKARPRLLEGWKAWMTSRIHTKESPKFHAKEQEAWQLDGKQIRGVFIASEKTPGMYLYWTDPKKWEAGKSYDTEVYSSELKEEPADMLELRYCRQYAEHRADLLKKMDSKQEWESFSTSCSTMQKNLTDYYLKVQNKRPAVTFQAEADLAGDVLGAWAKVQRIIK